MKVEIASQSCRARRDGDMGRIREYAAEVRVGVYSGRYDSVIGEALTPGTFGQFAKLAYSSAADGRSSMLHDSSDHGVALGFVVQVFGRAVCPYPFLKTLGLSREEFEEKVEAENLTPDDLRKILAWAFRRERRKWVGDMRDKCRDLSDAFSNRLSGDEEAEKFGRPFTPVQVELYAALEKELEDLERGKSAEEENLDERRERERDEAQARCDEECAEISSRYEKLLDESAKKYDGRITEVRKAMDEVAA
jgi:hypothetical protein